MIETFAHVLSFYCYLICTLRCLIEGGVGISGGGGGGGGGGGLEKSPKHNKRVGWNSRGGWK